MSLRGWLTKEVRDLRGSWSRVDSNRVLPNRAFFCKNVRFDTGRILTRFGLNSFALVGGTVTSIYDWQTSAFGRVLFFEAPDKLRSLNRSNFAEPAVTLYTLAGRAASVAEYGGQAFIAIYNNAGLGAGQAYVAIPDTASSAATADKAFAPPWTIAPVISDTGTGAGQVTEGGHLFAYIVETRSGFTGKPSPQPANVFTPTAFTVAAGGRVLRMDITGTFPADAKFIHPIMTRVNNPDAWYFVPDAQVPVPIGGPATIIAVINVSDEDLANAAEPVNDENGDLFQALTQKVDGTGPFHPSVVFNYGNRLAWVVDKKVYFSDIDDPQFVTEDQHAIQIPGGRRIITGCQLRGSAYLFGPQWTYEISDNGDFPKSWARPAQVSSSIGTPCPAGIEWRTGSGDFLWVVSRSGLYMFNGQYIPRPISYYNTVEWARINWEASHVITIRDDYINQRVLMAVPLDANMECSHVFCWSYARGMTPEDVDFSFFDYDFTAFGTIGLVQDPLTLNNVLWISPIGGGSISREDPTQLTDVGGLIDGQWESGFVLGGEGRRQINRFGGLDISIAGSGLLTYSAFSPDRLRSATDTINLSPFPGEEFQDRFDLTEEDISIGFYSAGLTSRIDLESFVVYHKPYGTGRY